LAANRDRACTSTVFNLRRVRRTARAIFNREQEIKIPFERSFSFRSAPTFPGMSRRGNTTRNGKRETNEEARNSLRTRVRWKWLGNRDEEKRGERGGLLKFPAREEFFPRVGWNMSAIKFINFCAGTKAALSLHNCSRFPDAPARDNRCKFSFLLARTGSSVDLRSTSARVPAVLALFPAEKLARVRLNYAPNPSIARQINGPIREPMFDARIARDNRDEN